MFVRSLLSGHWLSSLRGVRIIAAVAAMVSFSLVGCLGLGICFLQFLLGPVQTTPKISEILSEDHEGHFAF